ncbi:MAG: molecular chaperone HtpG [Lachnospiraceae bacterium]|nr:molecular chaperone HtpG [Lachnospiraceae bacterium]
MAEKGTLSINSENMFPIIKKWLYSDQDIFLRELISNGCDAITKLKKLEMMGEFTMPEGYRPRIDVVVSPQDKTLQVIDNGLGMTGDEVKEYINNIAFSGAEDFLAKYQDKANADQIIGHFGLGFYSAFMVSDLVTIDTLSYRSASDSAVKAVRWSCDGSSSYELEETTRESFGTTITLHLSEDCLQFANYYKAKETLDKYCAFMPVEIFLSEKDTAQTQTIDEEERRPDDVVTETIEPSEEEKKNGKKRQLKIRKRPELTNDTAPLWTKNPSECSDEDYKAFYRKVFNDYKEPLFWIHLNMDYPFNLKGILYFPKINLEYESAEGVIKLYNNQVFIADNIKEVIPEFLMLLKGVIDCPDLPLNVSRSALQNDGFVNRISEYITKKVADKLSGMCRTDKENYEKYWNDISPFIKYGCLRDDKFCEKMTDYILFKDLDGAYLTLPEALEVNRIDPDAEEEGEDKAEATPEETGASEEKKDEETGDAGEEAKERTIYYVTDEEQQGQYVRMFRARGLKAFVLDRAIDQPFISQLEAKNEGIHFARIDAGIEDALKSRVGKKAAEEMEKTAQTLTEIFKKALKKDSFSVKLEKLKDKKISSILTVDEQSRRFADMMKMYSQGGAGFPGAGEEGKCLVLNAGHPLVKYVTDHAEDESAKDSVKLICEQLFDLARIQNAPLAADDMEKFVARSNDVLMLLTGEK